MTVSSYVIERLPNGFVRVDDRVSGLVGLFNPDGSLHSGDIRRVPVDVHTAILRTAR
jgi:hypothetical protein